MYIYSAKDNVQHIGARNTRNARKFVFKVEAKIGTKYGNSPFFRGTTLWNKLTRDMQYSEDNGYLNLRSQKCISALILLSYEFGRNQSIRYHIEIISCILESMKSM